MKKKRKNIKTLTIYRNLWGRAALLGETGNRMCCLGHLGIACGVPKEKLRNEGMPTDLSSSLQALFPKQCDYEFYAEASYINDDSVGNTQSKEKQLKELFRKKGINLRFTGLRCQARVANKGNMAK